METNLAYKLEPREEVIAGELVMMAPARSNHNRVAGNLYSLLRQYLRGRLCEAFPDGEGLYLEEDAEEYQPDGMVVCDPSKVTGDGVHGAPDLVIEVLSRSTAKYDRGHKMAVYERHGVREYWIADPVGMSLEQYVLTEGRFRLIGVHHQYFPWELEAMKPKERAEVETEFRCHIFPDLSLRLDEVFARVVPETA